MTDDFFQDVAGFSREDLRRTSESLEALGRSGLIDRPEGWALLGLKVAAAGFDLDVNTGAGSGPFSAALLDVLQESLTEQRRDRGRTLREPLDTLYVRSGRMEAVIRTKVVDPIRRVLGDNPLHPTFLRDAVGNEQITKGRTSVFNRGLTRVEKAGLRDEGLGTRIVLQDG